MTVVIVIRPVRRERHSQADIHDTNGSKIQEKETLCTKIQGVSFDVDVKVYRKFGWKVFERFSWRCCAFSRLSRVVGQLYRGLPSHTPQHKSAPTLKYQNTLFGFINVLSNSNTHIYISLYHITHS